MQLQVDSHTHSMASGHAYSTLQEMAQAASDRNLKMFALTDHAPAAPGAPHKWHFTNAKIIPRFMYGVAVIRGGEVNIMNEQGDIDLGAHDRRHLDWLIGSLHNPVFIPSDKAIHTKALINAIEAGIIHAIGHPGNPEFDIDFESVVKTAAANNVAIELNDSSFRQSRPGSAPRCKAIAECARDYGAFITTGSDAHISYDVGVLSHCSALLDQINFPKEKVITRTPSSFLSFLRLRGANPIPEFEHLLD